MPPTQSETQKDEEKIQQGHESEGGRVRKIERFVYGFQVDLMLSNRFKILLKFSQDPFKPSKINPRGR